MTKEEFKKLTDEGINFIHQGDYQRAIEVITKSIEINPNWEISYFYRAVANHAHEKFDDAILDYTKTLKINPEMIDAYFNRAKIILEKKEITPHTLDNVIEDLNEALKRDEKFTDALFAMACAQKKKENYQLSLEYLDKLLMICPEAIQAKALKKLLLQKYVK